MAPALNSYASTSYVKKRVTKTHGSHKKHLIELSKAEQVQVAKALINPSEPIERFKRAAVRHAKMALA